MPSSLPLPGYESFSADDRLCVDEVADIMGVSAATLSRWRSKRTGPPFEQASRFVVFYRLGAVVAWRDRPSEKA